ncbi:ATP-binding cassette domain-containing protein [Rhodovulum sp. YNF3179]|uniref:ATP-binding cassette domain-containing protein n=1 Tax=Rhodovulum sp. YNF3179 TaxID=3425127 RepID=UPI003D325970
MADARRGETGLVLDRLRIAIGGTELVAVDATVRPGEVLTVMGPSGSGKSTLLSVVTGTVDPAFTVAGGVRVNGRELTGLPPEARRVGLLFQDELLFPHMSVGSNLAFGLNRGVRGRAARRARVEEALAEVGLKGFADRDPATLSGGQKARVALMRVLLSEPDALLLDEPFSRLDPDRRDRVRRLVFDRARAHGLPVLLVTHDAADARAAGGRIIRLESS